MDNKQMKKMVIRASVFTVLSMAVMLHRSATKHIMITDAAGTQVDRGNATECFKLLVDDKVSPGKEGVLTIPLPKSVSSDDIVLEDRYMDRELLIYIDSTESGYYLDNAVVTDLKNIESAVCTCENNTGSVCLDFKMDGLYANESLMTDQGTIEVTFCKPKERYDRVVVIDPVGGGSETGDCSGDLKEKDIALSVAKQLKNMAEKDIGVRTKLYFTRLEDEAVDEEKRAEFAKEASADLYIRLGAGSSTDSKKSGVMAEYNDSFFLRGLSNAEFADLLEKNCVSSMNCNAAGCEITEDELLLGLRIPAAGINVGYLSNIQDAGLMTDKAYAQKAADGIYRGILEALKEIE